MLLVQNNNIKDLYSLSSKLMEMHWNQSFSLNDECFKNIGALRHEFDSYSDFYLIKSLLCFVLLAPFNILYSELKPQVKVLSE
jgi:hypothetical protein